MRKNNHIQVDFFYRLLPRRRCACMSTLVDVVRIVFFGYCVVAHLAADAARSARSRMAIVDLPMGIVYGVVLVGFVLMTLARAAAWRVANWKRGASVLEAARAGGGERSDGPGSLQAALPRR